MSNIKFYPSTQQDVNIHISVLERPNEKVKVIGFPVSAYTKIPLDGFGSIQRSGTKKTESETTAYVINIIEEKLRKKVKGKSTSFTPEEKGCFTKAFDSIQDKSVLCSPKWGASTFVSALSYFRRNILSQLDQYGPDVSVEEIEEIRKNLINKALQSENSNKNPVQAESSVAAELYRCNYIYKAMSAVLSEYQLPSLDFQGDLKISIVTPEQCKAIPNDVRVKIATILFRIVDNFLVVGVAMMLFCGLRPAEAAAIRICDINFHGNFATYDVTAQIKNRKRVDVLKTEAAYRRVILPNICVQLIKKHMETLAKYNLPQESPLVSHPENIDVFANGNEISALGKKILHLAGISDEMFLATAALMTIEPDTDVDGKPLTDITAYVARRDFVTRAYNICGMDVNDIDYLIGHKNGNSMIRDYFSEATNQIIATELERFVFLPEYSRNPAFLAIDATPGTPIDIPIGDVIRLRATPNKRQKFLTVFISACEPGENITITLNNKAKAVDPVVGPRDNADLRRNRPVIGQTQTLEYYNSLIATAEKIDLSEIQ